MTVRRAIAVIAIAGSVLAGAVPAGASSLSSHLLSQTEMPAGWTSLGNPHEVAFTGTCLGTARSILKQKDWAKVGYTERTASVDEFVAGSAGSDGWKALRSDLARCRTFALRLDTKTLSGSISRLPFPAVGTESAAYKLTLRANAIFALVHDVVLFRTRSYYGVLAFNRVGTPDVTTVRSIAKLAVAKAAGQTSPNP